MRVDEHLVKISAGYIVVDAPLELDDDVTLIVRGAVTKTEDKTNNDGTFNRVYTVKGIITECLKT